MKLSNYWGGYTGKWRGKAKVISFGRSWHPSRSAARKAYAAQGYRGRVQLDRPKMKRRGSKYAPPKCKDCGDHGFLMDWRQTWDGPEEFEVPCSCRAA
jgi:hypothetical protein